MKTEGEMRDGCSGCETSFENVCGGLNSSAKGSVPWKTMNAKPEATGTDWTKRMEKAAKLWRSASPCGYKR